MSISREQALDCFASDDLIGIGMEADAIRRRLHPEGVVSYALDAAIVVFDDFRRVSEQVAEALERGATGIILRSADIRDLVSSKQLLSSLKQHFPQMHTQAFSADAIASLAVASNLTATEVLTRLRSAGLNSLNGDRGKGPDELYLQIHRAAHQVGIPSTAELVFGAGESMEDRVAFLGAIRTVQAETQGFLAFTLTGAPAPTGRELDDPTAVEYLKTLAICRMVLDNVPNLQANLRQQGLKVLQMGLRFGGNDAGAIRDSLASEEELRRVIRDAGFRPAQRDTLYRAMFLN
jgi:cyclic dehypoxanthinyl futalosine synthase